MARAYQSCISGDSGSACYPWLLRIDRVLETFFVMATTILTASNLAQRFITDLIFSNVNFQVNEREHIALVGANGAGKSTLLKIIAGQQDPSEGSIVTQA